MEPDVLTLTLNSRKKVNLEEIFSELETYKGYRIGKEKGAAILAFVEEESLEKKPEEFFIIRFKENSIEIIYTVEPDESPSLRRLQVLSKTLPLIEPMLKYYDIPSSVVFSLISVSLEDFLKKFTKDMKDLVVENDSLREKVKMLQEKEMSCQQQVKDLTAKLYEVNSQLSELRLRLRKFETPSDEVLEEMLIEWIKEHNGTIDIAEFSRVNRVPITRVERALNELVDKRYLKPQ